MVSIKRRATQERCRLEREHIAKLQLNGTRLEEDEAIRIFKNIPSVQAIAHKMRQDALKPTPEKQKESSFLDRMYAWLDKLLGR